MQGFSPTQPKRKKVDPGNTASQLHLVVRFFVCGSLLDVLPADEPQHAPPPDGRARIHEGWPGRPPAPADDGQQHRGVVCEHAEVEAAEAYQV